MSSSDLIQMSCPSCGQALQLPSAHAGKKGRCRACQSVFQIPAAGPTPKPLPTGKVSPAPAVRPQPRSGVPSPPAGSATAADAGNELVPLDMNDPFSVSGMSPQSFGNLNPGFGSPPGFGPSPGLTPVNPAFEAGDEFRLAPAPEPMYSPPAPNPYHAPQHGYTPSYSSGGGGVAWGKVGSGAGMMLLAVVWFVGGLAAGYIFFYPPILLIIGLVTMITGLCGSSD